MTLKELRMKRAVLGVVLLLILAFPSCNYAADNTRRALPPIEIFFSPNGGCTEAILREIQDAKSNVLVQAYSFTSAPIAEALVDAHKRGVKIEVILDKSQRTEKYSSADFLVNMGITTKIDDRHAIAHNKIIIIDGKVVITGSFNFTKSAEQSNAENLLIIRDKPLAEKYTANWQKHAEHSEKYKAREKGYSETVRPASQVPDVAEAGYVASTGSRVFHRPGCRSAAKISAKNLVRYGTRDEAIQAGKRPCAECKP
jgi:phosphatidylserine/phosphatidylglycerophosphate/cardiolipin synthase-like enzyme